MKYVIFLITVLLLSLGRSCQEDNTAQRNCDTGQIGTLVDLEGLDGCKWVISDKEDQRYEPINLNDFDLELEDGKQVCFSYVLREDMASICMVGKIIELTAIQ